MVAAADFYPTDRFDLGAMQEFMRRPDIYLPAADAISPPSEIVDFITYLSHPNTYTIAAMCQGQIVGHVHFIQRTSIGGEIHTGFRPEVRGKIAKTFIEYSIQTAFHTKGFLKLWALIPSDNRPAIRLAGLLGFQREGRLTRAISRVESKWEAAGLKDILILGLNKPDTRS